MSDTPFRCGRFVVARIHQLLGKDPGNLSPSSRALLAQLRQAESAEPGTAPGVWAVTAEGLPDSLRGTELGRVETAIHVALTQFAVHQQARGASMHDPKRTFGAAIRALATRSNPEKPHDTPMYRRFTAMVTATTLPALLASSRGLITQLRGEEIGFDYGRYADDLHGFQVPGRSAQIRRGWGLDFHRIPATPDQTMNETPGE